MNETRPTKLAEQHPLDLFGGGMLNHSEEAAPAREAPEPLVTTLVSAALGSKIPLWEGD